MSTTKKAPEIRFKGFSGEWEECPLSKFISSLDAGVSVNSGGNPAGEGEFGILKTSCVTNGVFDPSENKVVSDSLEINRLKEPVLKNTIIISRMNTPALVGANAYIDRSYSNYFLPDRLWTAKPTTSGDLQFIANILGSAKGREALSGLATGTSGSMKNISKPSVLELKFHVPKDPEQTQIGNTFQKLDSLINQHQQKHDKLSSIKKAMLEKMFPKPGETVPQIRFKGFSGEWEESSLFEETIVSTGFPFDSSDFCGSGNLLVITNGNIQNSSSAVNGKVGNRIANEKVDLLNQYALNIGDILVTMDGSVGRTAKVIEPNQILAQRVGRLVAKNNTEFLYQSLNTGAFLDGMTTISHGGTIKHISLSEIGSYRLLVPDNLEEQEKIGNYLKKLDTLINQHQQQITKLTHIKQACLSKMFV